MTRTTVCITMLSTCLLALSVDSVIIRNWRNKAKLVPAISDNTTSSSFQPVVRRQPPKTKRRGFRPTETRCCKIGEKAAKRKMSCDRQEIEVLRRYNDLQRAKMKYNRPSMFKQSRISAKLSNKLKKCMASFHKYYEKCCKYRQAFYRNMNKCKRKRGKEKKTCRQSVRRRYKAQTAGRTASKGARRRNGK